MNYNPPAPHARWGLKENIQLFSYRLTKPSKPIFSPKVEKNEANSPFLGQKKLAITQALKAQIQKFQSQ